jgi:hypothetical protein
MKSGEKPKSHYAPSERLFCPILGNIKPSFLDATVLLTFSLIVSGRGRRHLPTHKAYSQKSGIKGHLVSSALGSDDDSPAATFSRMNQHSNVYFSFSS